MTEVTGLNMRLKDWLLRVRALRWAQADLLQVMEELEPHARAALRIYFILRAGLPAAYAGTEGAAQGIDAGIRGLPTVDAAAELAEAARLSPDNPVRIETLARYGHRGPGEIGPAARRWSDEPELLDGLKAVLSDLEPQPLPDPARDHARNDAFALIRAADIAWDAVTLVAAAAQQWAQAAAKEALAARLIARPADVLYMELEELKQVATGEWHRGRSETVQEQVEQRRAAMMAPTSYQNSAAPQAPGAVARVTGPVYLGSPHVEMPPTGAVWLSETLDPGCAPFWPAATAVVAAAADPWSPGVIAARALGVPCVIGASDLVASAQAGQMISL
jgi:phosphohistidine swiveling domain-containing protein